MTFGIKTDHGSGGGIKAISNERKKFVVHCLENIIALRLILFFAINDNFNCAYDICDDKSIRSINGNVCVLVYTVICCIAMVIEIILFVVTFLIVI